MDILGKWMTEAKAMLMTKSEYFIATRNDGFTEAINTSSGEFEGLSKNELEDKRHEHRARRRVLAEKLDDATISFTSFYMLCMFTLDAWLPLLILLLFGIYLGGYGLVLSLFLFILNLVLFGISSVLVRRQVEKSIELYKLLGFAEGMISLSDYRELEKFDLSRLPDIEVILGEAPY